LTVSNLISEKIEPNFVVDRPAELANVGTHLDVLRDLLRAKREQHAKNHDADFTDELTPAVQRLEGVNVHGAHPPEGRHDLTVVTPSV
jgi:hypothetical protein